MALLALQGGLVRPRLAIPFGFLLSARRLQRLQRSTTWTMRVKKAARGLSCILQGDGPSSTVYSGRDQDLVYGVSTGNLAVTQDNQTVGYRGGN